MNKTEVFIRKLEDIAELVSYECECIDTGKTSEWT